MSRSDRVAKYNQLIRIEEALGEKAPYNGRKEIKGRISLTLSDLKCQPSGWRFLWLSYQRPDAPPPPEEPPPPLNPPPEPPPLEPPPEEDEEEPFLEALSLLSFCIWRVAFY